MTHRSRFIFCCLWMIGVLFVSGISTAIAESDGRYRAIVLHEGGSSSTSATLLPKVFIMDSRDGHMWTWEQNTRIKTQKGEPTFGNALIYQGRVDPGKKVGEVITQ